MSDEFSIENNKSSARRKKLLPARWCRSSLIQLHHFKTPATVSVPSGCLSVAGVVMVSGEAETLRRSDGSKTLKPSRLGNDFCG